MSRSKRLLTQTLLRLYRGIWFFPILVAIPLIIFTTLGISGSSIGVYHKLFYGKTHDNNLLFSQPQAIRGDEWNSVTQFTLAQSKNNYHQVNSNIGNGQNLSLIEDVPYKDWSMVFKPQNLSFFVMPLNNAFAFKWWLMLYLLIVSCYFFVLALLPGKRLVASLLALGFAFNPFIQWWYQYMTLGSLYYTLFTGVIFMAILKAKRLRTQVLWGLLLAYILTCFALVLYPPFQISCALALVGFAVGYLVMLFRADSFKAYLRPLAIMAGAATIAGILTLAFFATRNDVINAVENTAYPGARVIQSGGYHKLHLISGQLSVQLKNIVNQQYYTWYMGGNQSEASNFVLLLPFLFLPALFLLVTDYVKRREIDWPLLTTSFMFILFLIRMYVPHTDIIFKLLLLEPVPLGRMLIGLGLLSLIHMVLMIRHLDKLKRFPANNSFVRAYIFLVWAACILISLYIQKSYPGFIGRREALLLSIPIPVIVYSLLTRRFVISSLGLLAFLLFSTLGINPLYKNVSTITQTPLAQAIQRISTTDRGRWATDSISYEQFPVVNGARTLTGAYSYPQFDLWKDSGANKDIYNRYAHIYLLLDKDPTKTVPSKLLLEAPDTIAIQTDPCSLFLKERGVHFLMLTSTVEDGCAVLQQKIVYPLQTFYIYKIQ